MLITDNELLIKAAKENYDKFLVPTNFVESVKSQRFYTPEQQADLDIKTSVNKIGEIINLSQELQSLMWEELNSGKSFEDVRELYYDICQLDVMSNLEIDRAKKEFPVENATELDRLRDKWKRTDEKGRAIKPYFFGFVAMNKGFYNNEKKNYMHHHTAMDYLEELIDKYRSPVDRGKKIPLTNIISFPDYDDDKARYVQIQVIIDAIREFEKYSKQLWSEANADVDPGIKYQDYNQKRNDLVELIDKKYDITSHTLYALLRQLELDKNKDIKSYLVDIFFSIKKSEAFKFIKQSHTPVAMLELNPAGEIRLYDLKFSKTYKF